MREKASPKGESPEHAGRPAGVPSPQSVSSPKGGTAEDPGARDDSRAPSPTSEYPPYAERVLDVAELIPPGRVMTYGDIAEWLEEGGPRQVGRAMALYGGAVPWWRVVRSDGALLPGHEQRALEHYRVEGTPLREATRSTSPGRPGARGQRALPRIDMRRARWDGATPTEAHT